MRSDSASPGEIDPLIIDIARNPRYFTYLQKAAVSSRVVSGDGRLSLEGEPRGSFDLLVLDAFTSDVVPAHLLTLEAMRLYMETLRPGALLAFHLSSRFYNLASAVGATARSLGLTAAGHAIVPDQAAMDRTGVSSSLLVVVGQPSDVARFTKRGWAPVPPGGPVLSDDYSDLTRLLVAGGG